jgi:hypothetical protein
LILRDRLQFKENVVGFQTSTYCTNSAVLKKS